MAILENRLKSASVVKELTETSFAEEVETSESEAAPLSGKTINSSGGEVSYNDPGKGDNTGSDISVKVSTVKGMKTTDKRAYVNEASGTYKSASAKFKSALSNIKVESASDAYSLFESIICYEPKAIELELPKYKSNLDRELGIVKLKCKDKTLETIINSYTNVIFKSYNNIVNELAETLDSNVNGMIDDVLDKTVGHLLKQITGTISSNMRECLLIPSINSIKEAILGKGLPLSARASLLNGDVKGGCLIALNLGESITDIIKGVVGGAILQKTLGKPHANKFIEKMLNDPENTKNKNITYINISIRYVLLSEDTSNVREKLLMLESVSSLTMDIELKTEINVIQRDMHDSVLRLISADDSPPTNSGISDRDLYIRILNTTNPRWYIEQDNTGNDVYNYSALKHSNKMKELVFTVIASTPASDVDIKVDANNCEYIKATTVIDINIGIFISTLSSKEIGCRHDINNIYSIDNNNPDNTPNYFENEIMYDGGYEDIKTPYIHSMYNPMTSNYYNNTKYTKCSRL